MALPITVFKNPEVGGSDLAGLLGMLEQGGEGGLAGLLAQIGGAGGLAGLEGLAGLLGPMGLFAGAGALGEFLGELFNPADINPTSQAADLFQKLGGGPLPYIGGPARSGAALDVGAIENFLMSALGISPAGATELPKVDLPTMEPPGSSGKGDRLVPKSEFDRLSELVTGGGDISGQPTQGGGGPQAPGTMTSRPATAAELAAQSYGYRAPAGYEGPTSVEGLMAKYTPEFPGRLNAGDVAPPIMPEPAVTDPTIVQPPTAPAYRTALPAQGAVGSGAGASATSTVSGPNYGGTPESNALLSPPTYGNATSTISDPNSLFDSKSLLNWLGLGLGGAGLAYSLLGKRGGDASDAQGFTALQTQQLNDLLRNSVTDPASKGSPELIDLLSQLSKAQLGGAISNTQTLTDLINKQGAGAGGVYDMLSKLVSEQTGGAAGLTHNLSGITQNLLAGLGPGLNDVTSAARKNISGAEELMGVLKSGNLPGGMQSIVDVAKQDAQTATKSRYANLGIGNSTMLDESLGEVDRRSGAAKASMLEDVFKLGMQEQQQGFGAIENLYQQGSQVTNQMSAQAASNSQAMLDTFFKQVNNLANQGALTAQEIVNMLLGGSGQQISALGLQNQIYQLLASRQLQEDQAFQTALMNFAKMLGGGGTTIKIGS